MSGPIVSIELIARQAAAAARLALDHPGKPLPENPYCRNMQPDHHAAWEERFDLAMQRARELDAEGSA